MRRIFRVVFSLLCIVWVCCGCVKQPSKADVKKAEKRQQDSLSLVAQERTLVYYDSLQQALAPELDALLPQFKYEKDERYEDKGHYVHRLLRTTSNTSRNYIQTYVRDDGRLNASLREIKEKALITDAGRILALLETRKGKMPYSDKTSPEVIRDKFGISKGAFKRALGHLLKEGRIEERDGWTYLIPSNFSDNTPNKEGFSSDVAK